MRPYGLANHVEAAARVPSRDDVGHCLRHGARPHRCPVADCGILRDQVRSADAKGGSGRTSTASRCRTCRARAGVLLSSLVCGPLTTGPHTSTCMADLWPIQILI